MNAFRRGSALDIGQVACQRLSKKFPGPLTVGACQYPRIDDAAERRSVRRSSHVVVNIARNEIRLEGVIELLLSSISRLFIRILIDIGCLCAAYVFACWSTRGPGQIWGDWVFSHTVYLYVLGGIWCVVSFDQHLYVSRRGESLTAVLFALGGCISSP